MMLLMMVIYCYDTILWNWQTTGDLFTMKELIFREKKNTMALIFSIVPIHIYRFTVPIWHLLRLTHFLQFFQLIFFPFICAQTTNWWVCVFFIDKFLWYWNQSGGKNTIWIIFLLLLLLLLRLCIKYGYVYEYVEL